MTETRVLTVRTEKREQFVDISAAISEFVRSSGVRKGLLVAFVPHTTAAVTINEGADPSVMKDIGAALGTLVPRDDPRYKHAEGNSDAHIKASLLGSTVHIPIVDGGLMLGRWQSVFFAEFDGPRQRRVNLFLY